MNAMTIVNEGMLDDEQMMKKIVGNIENLEKTVLEPQELIYDIIHACVVRWKQWRWE